MELPVNRLKTPRSTRRRPRGSRSLRLRLLPLAVLLLGGVFLGFFLLQPRTKIETIPGKQSVLELWKRSDWSAVRSACDRALEKRPLDPFYLGMRGVASFYDAMGLPEGAEREGLLAASVASIRKALAAGGEDGSLPRAQLDYVLAKAYYHVDPSNLDLAAAYLAEAQAKGYEAPDLHEYLAMIQAGLGNDEAAAAEFELALARDQSPLLRIAAASVYSRLGKTDRAEGLLKDALSSTQDSVATEKARLLLAQLYFGESRWDDCEAQLNALVAENAQSAEAHYQLGLLYQAKGDLIHARAEWRKAVSIDPMHAGARQKLAERS